MVEDKPHRVLLVGTTGSAMAGACLVPGSAERAAGRAGVVPGYYFPLPHERPSATPHWSVAFLSLEKHMESNLLFQCKEGLRFHLADPGPCPWCGQSRDLCGQDERPQAHSDNWDGSG